MEAQAGQGAQKVPLYSINDLKNATDDALSPYLTKLPAPFAFEQSHYLTNVRLASGYSAVVIAAVTFYFDYTLGWDATKLYTAGACALYFILNGFLTLWMWKVEGDTVFVGIRAKDKLTLRSSVKKNVPIYKLKVLHESSSGQKLEAKEVEGRFTEWFDDQGWLHPKELRRWLAANIEVIGKATPQEKKSVAAGNLSATEIPTLYSASEISDGSKSMRRSKKRG